MKLVGVFRVGRRATEPRSAGAVRPLSAALLALLLLGSVILGLGGREPAVAVREPGSTATSAPTPTWALHPFSATSPWNAPISASRPFEAEDGPMTSALRTATPVVNSSSWSVVVRQASSSDPLVTLDAIRNRTSFTLHIPADTVSTAGNDRHVTVVQPDGVTAYDMYKFERAPTGGWTAQYVVAVDLRGEGVEAGTRASGLPAMAGLIRAQELAEADIPHAIALGLPGSVLRPGFVWPASQQDADTSTYGGSVPMGALVAIPPDVDLGWIPLTSPEGRALARALQAHGAYVVDRSNTAAIFCELSCDTEQTTRLERDWERLFPYLRVATSPAS